MCRVKKIVIIDPSLDSTKKLAQRLNNLGYNVIRALDHKTGFDLIDNFKPDLVILSLTDDSLNTEETFFHEKSFEFPVLGFSNNCSNKTIIKAYRNGVSDVIDINDSQQEIDSIINKSIEKYKRDKSLEIQFRDLKKDIYGDGELLERIFTQFMNYVSVSVFIKTVDSRYLFVNNNMKELFKLSEYAGKHTDEIFEKSFAEELTNEDKIVLEKGFVEFDKKLVFDGEIKRLKIQKFLINRINNQPLIGGIAFDITKNINDQSEISKLASVVENSLHSVMICDKNGFIEYVNQRYLDVTGFKRDEVVGRKSNLTKSGRHSHEFYADIWSTISAGSFWKGTIFNKKKDGMIYKEDAIIYPLFNVDKEISNYVAVKKDVTKESLLEEQLKHSQKMEAIGTLAGGIAHDINNILTIIYGSSYILLRTLGEGKVRNKIQDIYEAADRMKKLVKRILTFSHKNENNMNSCQISIYVKETIKLLKSTLPKNIIIRRNIDSNSIAYIDPSEIQQIVMNLCTNSIYAMKDIQGELSISLVDVNWNNLNSHLHLILKKSNYVLLSIEDNGKGIAKENLTRIFDPYFTTKGKDGTGLGLSMVHGIVKSYDGHIEVVSEEDKGTTFKIYLPIAEEAAIKPISDFSSLESGVIEPKRILLVDDEKKIVENVSELLEMVGHQVTCFTDSKKAIDEVKRNVRSYDIIISDMSMPNYTGLDIIQAAGDNIPVIIITGFTSSFDMKKAEELGVAKILHKPLEGKILLNEIQLATKRDRQEI
ncbi:MAG: response regulator [Candidatus Delongbacteria bacterium]|nr:response regulator [Candidatus Delongbacteria bacterium]MBN2835799.1 response regulator [Candidatus Delongbacteria bacterium]